MSQLETFKLDDLVEFQNGGTWTADSYSDSGIKVVRVSDIQNGTVDLSDCNYLPQELWSKYKKHKLEKDDLVICTVGSHPTQPGSVVGRSCKVPIKASGALLNQNAVRLRPSVDYLDKLYLAYLGESPLMRNYIISNARGSANQVRMSITALKKFEVKLPDLETQQKIASILSAFDDLIENNTRRIAILEETARLIYREWFVHYCYPGHEDDRLEDSGTDLGDVPEGWETVEAQDIINFNPRTSLDKDKERRYLPMGNVSENSMVIDDSELEKRTGGSGTKFKNLDTLFARITPSLENGKTGFVQFLSDGEIALGSTEFIVMRSIDVNPYYVYCLARDDRFRETAIKSMAGASGRQRVRVNSIKEYKLPLPSKKILNAFDRIVKPMFEQIQLLTEHNKNLRSTRDLLLPKLISGEG